MVSLLAFNFSPGRVQEQVRKHNVYIWECPRSAGDPTLDLLEDPGHGLVQQFQPDLGSLLPGQVGTPLAAAAPG